MDDHVRLPLLLARIASLEEQVKGDRVLIEQLRQQVRMATRAEEILKRAEPETGPLPVVPKPRPHRRARSRDVTYLRVVKAVAVACLAAGVLGGAIIPASSLVTGPSPASAGTTFAGMEQDHVDAAEAGLCDGQLPEVGEWPGSDALVGAGRSPFGVVAFGGDAARVIAGGWCGG